MAREQPTILVVEDDPGVALLQRRRLERADFAVEIAVDVDAAMTRLGRGGVALVVMDYRLGTTTGLDLHRRMKAAGFDTPVIIVSGAMDDRTVIEAIRGGVRDVIVKSTDYLDYLPDAVRAVLRQSADVAEQRPQDQRTPTVLVVEDDAGVALLERRRLERAGYEVEIAGNAADAIEVVGKGNVSVAVLDLRLPGEVSGIDLYEQFKAAGWQVPAILVTGFPDQAVAIRALRAGIRDFVPKSADYLEYLPAAVERVVSQARVERKLVESELRLASIIGTTMDAILMCDEQRRIVLFNPSAEDMFGCPAADAMTRPIDSFLPGLPLVGSLGGTAEAGTLRHRTEIDGVRVGGERIPIEVTVSEVVVHDRRLFTVIARDVSERRRIEAELREADRRKDEFLGMLAHELRNPLAAIMGAGEVLHQSVQGPHAQKLTSVVTRQTRALARMVDDLLDVSRVTLGKIRLATEPLVFSQVVGRAAEHLRDSVVKAGIELDVRIDPEPLWIRGDPTRLEQVMANLVGNAVKFTPSGGRITIAAGRDGDEAVIHVRDTGAGIEPALVPKVFDLFVQGDTSLARSRSGLGIGLALVRQVVALHGGRVTAFSEGAGKGSHFTVRLPLAAEEVSTDDETPRPAFAAERMRIIVVDDQKDVADAMALLIEALGHETQAAYDAVAAIAKCRANPPDVMFVDIGMPGVNGYELAQHIRGDRRLSTVHLVALTGYGREEDRARAYDAGFDLHLTKPVDDAKLQEVLATIAGSLRRAR